MRRIDALLADYGSSHRTRGNLICHAVGITLIVFGVLVMLRTFRVAGPWTAAEPVLALVAAVYVLLDVPLGLATVAVLVLLDLAARAVPHWGWGAAAFVVGWIFQGIGHAVYEKKSPAFLRNLAHLLVGPAFLVNEALRIHRPAPAALNKKSS
ncbi:MAG TPA: Mpo1-like protein [Thermoanaerobaculia bacterium]